MNSIEINHFTAQVRSLVAQMDARIAAAPAAVAEKNRPALDKAKTALASLEAGNVQELKASSGLILPSQWLARVVKA